VYFVPNVGTKDKPSWGDAVRVEHRADATGKAKEAGMDFLAGATGRKSAKASDGHEFVSAQGDAGPCVADWDGDGVFDLLVGGGDGEVRWYRNSSKTGLPALEAPRTLIPGAKWGKKGQEDREGVPKELGTRSKVCVADWNGDGLADLVLGDFSSTSGPEPELTDAQKAERDRLQKEQEDLWEKMNPCFERASKAASEAVGGASHEDMTDEQQEAFSEAYRKALEAEADYKALQEKQQAVSKALRPLIAPHETHGYVWVFLRDAPKPQR